MTTVEEFADSVQRFLKAHTAIQAKVEELTGAKAQHLEAVGAAIVAAAEELEKRLTAAA